MPLFALVDVSWFDSSCFDVVVWVHYFESVCILAGVIFCLDVGLSPPPGEHLGLFCGNQKTHFFASFATNGNTARVKTAPYAR